MYFVPKKQILQRLSVTCTLNWVVFNERKFSFPSHSLDIEADFRDNLKVLVPALLASENLRIKQIHGSNVTGRSLLEYFKVLTHLHHEHAGKFATNKLLGES